MNSYISYGSFVMLLNKNYLENYFKGKSKEEGINYLVLSVSIMTAMGQCGVYGQVTILLWALDGPILAKYIVVISLQKQTNELVCTSLKERRFLTYFFPFSS
jgi:hypothetical protein